MTPTTHERTYQLPRGFQVTFVKPAAGDLRAIWDPHMPVIRKRAARERFLAAYQAARREFFEELATLIGGNVLLVDVRPDGGLETYPIRPAERH